MAYQILTDTSANLPSSLLKAAGIPALPFTYLIEGKPTVCTDTESFDGNAYYSAIQNGAKVTTAQINPQAYIDAMTPLLEKGKDVLYIGMSSGISGSFRSACMAASELQEQYPDRVIALWDTKAASLGEGIPVLLASRMQKEGAALEDVVEALGDWRRRTVQIFTVDDLMHLRRTGRLSGAAAIVGTALQIKPLLKGDIDGKIVFCGKVRGRKQSIHALARHYDSVVEHAENQLVGIAHANAPEEAALLASLIRQNHPPKDILTVCYEPVTGAHVGPGTVALFFMGGPDARKR